MVFIYNLVHSMFYYFYYFNLIKIIKILLFCKYGLMVVDFTADNISGIYILIQAFQ